MLFLHLPEALQTLPALRDIRDGPVELLGQRLVRVLGPAVPLAPERRVERLPAVWRPLICQILLGVL